MSALDAAPCGDREPLPEGRKQEVSAPAVTGIVLIDKPAGPTSFQMVRLVRRALGIKKVGHSGTLDPFASGLLVVCIGRPATRIIDRLMGGVKEYEAVVQLGVETETQDPEGAVVARRPVVDVTLDRIAACLPRFTGEIWQAPPRFSALKHQGKPLYHYARRGIVVEKEPRLVTVHAIRLLAVKEDRLTLRVVCGKGTYIRSLAADIGNALGCGGHLTALRRLRNGQFSVKDALPGDQLRVEGRAEELLRRHLLPVETVLESLTKEEFEQNNNIMDS